jgi:hypothetical protein
VMAFNIDHKSFVFKTDTKLTKDLMYKINRIHITSTPLLSA